MKMAKNSRKNEEHKPRISKISIGVKRKDVQNEAQEIDNDELDNEKLEADEELNDEERANAKAIEFAENFLIDQEHTIVCFGDDSFFSVCSPYAIMQRTGDLKNPRYRFVTVGQTGRSKQRTTIRALSFNEYISLAESEGRDISEMSPLPDPEKLSSRENINKRIEESLGTYCIMANSGDYCHWVLTGLQKGFFTTGEFLEVVI